MKFVIAGAGGHGKVVCDALFAAGEGADVLGFVDDDASRVGGRVAGLPILGRLESAGVPPGTGIVVAIGDNGARLRQFERAIAFGFEPVTVVHPHAVIGRGVMLGRGVVVFANVVVNPDTRIGDNAILNTSCSIDHDCVIGSHVHVAPGVRIGGGVVVGDRTLIGIGSTVLPGVRIGTGCVIGAGAVVVRSVGDRTVAIGVPARPIAQREESRRG